MSENLQIDFPDHQLVIAAQDGRPDALKALISRFHPRLLRCIKYHAGNDAPAEDLAQDCWYAIISRLNDLKLQVSFNAFIATVARRRAIDWIRKEQRNRLRYSSEPLSSDIGVSSPKEDKTEQQLALIREGILQLPATQRIILSMFYLENRSLKNIAEQLRISEGTVKSRLFYARESLKQQLTQNTEV